MSDFILAYDIGTTGAKVSLFKIDKSIELIGSAYKQYETYYPNPNWLEQSPLDWWNAVVESTNQIVRESNVDRNRIAAISFSGQMMCAIPIDAKGDLLLDRVPIWADARSTEQVKRLFAEIGGYEEFYKITMQGHNPELYPIFKAMWIKENLHSVYQKTAKFIHSKEFIALKMTGKCFTDYSDQGLGGTLDIKKHTWSDTMLDAAGD